MTIKNILWVEDNPSFLERTVAHAEELGISREEFFDIITLVPDASNAYKSIQNDDYDAFVLDFDFPTKLYPERIAEISDFLEDLRKGHPAKLETLESKELHTGWMIINGDLKYQREKILISSKSGFAKMAALYENIPFFGKNSYDNEKTVRQELVNLDKPKLFRQLLSVSEYEGMVYGRSQTLPCGGQKELVEYLLNL